MYTFHKTVHGYGHIHNGQPCEDASASWCDEDGRYFIAAVADGHGQSRSFRSAAGARMAAETAVECFRELAETVFSSAEEEIEFYGDMLESTSRGNARIRQLTDTILARWHNAVGLDYALNPPEAEELGEYEGYYQDAERIPEIYGTTLIAALWLTKCLVLVHQGDGRCDVFYEDGSVDQPIPWDEKCCGNICTSLCDTDAGQRFRHSVIDLEKKTVYACYLGTDGVEDAYRDQEGTHIFYKDISCSLTELGPEAFSAYLDEMLPDFSVRGRYSQSGSHDDVSVAGIVDIKNLRLLCPGFRQEIRHFQLEEKLLYAEAQLAGKQRKYGILDNRRKEAKQKLEAMRDEAEREKQQKIWQKEEAAFASYEKTYREIQSEMESIRLELNRFYEVYHEEENTWKRL